MAVKSYLSDSNTLKKDWIPEKFPLTKGMQGENIKALQRELNIPADGFLYLQTEHHIIALGYKLPLSEEDYRKIVKAEHVKIYEWIIGNINMSTNPFQLDGCSALVNFFKNRKFKKDNPSKSEIEMLATSLADSINTKRNTIHTRNHREKKNNQ